MLKPNKRGESPQNTAYEANSTSMAICTAPYTICQRFTDGVVGRGSFWTNFFILKLISIYMKN